MQRNFRLKKKIANYQLHPCYCNFPEIFCLQLQKMTETKQGKGGITVDSNKKKKWGGEAETVPVYDRFTGPAL